MNEFGCLKGAGRNSQQCLQAAVVSGLTSQWKFGHRHRRVPRHRAGSTSTDSKRRSTGLSRRREAPYPTQNFQDGGGRVGCLLTRQTAPADATKSPLLPGRCLRARGHRIGRLCPRNRSPTWSAAFLLYSEVPRPQPRLNCGEVNSSSATRFCAEDFEVVAQRSQLPRGSPIPAALRIVVSFSLGSLRLLRNARSLLYVTSEYVEKSTAPARLGLR